MFMSLLWKKRTPPPRRDPGSVELSERVLTAAATLDAYVESLRMEAVTPHDPARGEPSAKQQPE